MSDVLISESYRRQQKQLHENPNYGVASIKFAPFVKELIENSSFQTLTDYGAGKRRLAEALSQANLQKPITYQAYDPAYEEYGPAKPADLVCCIDVLEHVEEDFLPNVLADIRGLTQQVAFLTVHMGPAGKTLPDGRNAHLIQQPTSWWLPLLSQYFEVMSLRRHQIMGPGFMTLVTPKI